MEFGELRTTYIRPVDDIQSLLNGIRRVAAEKSQETYDKLRLEQERTRSVHVVMTRARRDDHVVVMTRARCDDHGVVMTRARCDDPSLLQHASELFYDGSSCILGHFLWD